MPTYKYLNHGGKRPHNWKSSLIRDRHILDHTCACIRQTDWHRPRWRLAFAASGYLVKASVVCMCVCVFVCVFVCMHTLTMWEPRLYHSHMRALASPHKLHADKNKIIHFHTADSRKLSLPAQIKFTTKTTHFHTAHFCKRSLPRAHKFTLIRKYSHKCTSLHADTRESIISSQPLLIHMVSLRSTHKLTCECANIYTNKHPYSLTKHTKTTHFLTHEQYSLPHTRKINCPTNTRTILTSSQTPRVPASSPYRAHINACVSRYSVLCKIDEEPPMSEETEIKMCGMYIQDCVVCTDQFCTYFTHSMHFDSAYIFLFFKSWRGTRNKSQVVVYMCI
jgi:hypothetical protein